MPACFRCTRPKYGSLPSVPEYCAVYASVQIHFVTSHPRPCFIIPSFPGAPLDASEGEAGHQRHKRANKSGSGRDPAAHHMRRVNTSLALGRCRRSQPWLATSFDRVHGREITRLVKPGAGCNRVLETLAGCLRGGIDSPVDPDEKTEPPRAAVAGRYPGAAKWDAKIVRGEAFAHDNSGMLEAEPAWRTCVAQSNIVPHETSILEAARVWYRCRRRPQDPRCGKAECPRCWTVGKIVNDSIRCSRFKHGAPPRASSGMGRWKGGNARSATNTAPTPRGWAVGDGAGEDIEIYVHPQARDNGLSGDGNVTLGKILYFFDHEGNPRPGSHDHDAGPTMEWVLVYEYVTCGRGRTKMADPVTLHPTYRLQGNSTTRPSIFPVDAIRRHVHMYHLCPAPVSTAPASAARRADNSARAGSISTRPTCGLRNEPNEVGATKVWRHHYTLATAAGAQGGVDKYMLNEHWHSAYQDGVV